MIFIFLISSLVPPSLPLGSYELVKDGILSRAETPFALFSNPAILSLDIKTNSAFSYRNDFMDIQTFSFSYKEKFSNLLYGAILTYRNYGFMEKFTLDEGYKGSFKPYDLFVTHAISRSIKGFLDQVGVGIGHKFLLRKIDNETLFDNFFDLGIVCLFRKASISFTLNNIPSSFYEIKVGGSLNLKGVFITVGTKYIPSSISPFKFLVGLEGKIERITIFTGLGNGVTAVGLSLPTKGVSFSYALRLHPLSDIHSITIGVK